MNTPSPYPQPAPRPAGASGRQRVNLPRAWVTWGLLAFTVLVYLGQLLSQALLQTDILINWGAKINEAIFAGQVWRLVTPIFLHGSILHIGFNMYALFILGPDLERYYGRTRFFLLYMLAGVAGNLVSFYFSPEASIGASTSLFGIMTAEGVLVYRNREIFGRRARPILTQIIFIIAINLFIGLAPTIDNWGHLGGLIGGLAFSWFAGPLFTMEMKMIQPQTDFPTGTSTPDPQPQVAMRLVNRVNTNRMWLVAGIETAVLILVAALRILRGPG